MYGYAVMRFGKYLTPFIESYARWSTHPSHAWVFATELDANKQQKKHGGDVVRVACRPMPVGPAPATPVTCG
jgi:hypothetical protein